MSADGLFLQHFSIRQGERPSSYPAPVGPVEEAAVVGSVAILGEDWLGLHPRMHVDEGARVTRGQVLFTDRRHREICFVAPVCGVVEKLTFGPRRSLDALILRIEHETEAFLAAPVSPTQSDPRETLLSAGFWPAFRARPFGTIPAPDDRPAAIIVNAVQAAPQAPNPADISGTHIGDFRRGCEIMARLTDGLVHICQSPGLPLGPEHERVRHASFAGTVAAGLAGTQIDRLCRGQAVWTIGHQDVAAIGAYFQTGQYPGHRVVSVTGPMALPPRLLRAPIGARLNDITGTGPMRALSGGPANGREAAYLGRFHDQITLLPPASRGRPRVWTSRRKGPHAALPTRALEHAIAADVLPVPLLRALSIGDAEAAERLGCLALIEEDLEAATRRCTSGIDYGSCLRAVLTELMSEAA